MNERNIEQTIDFIIWLFLLYHREEKRRNRLKQEKLEQTNTFDKIQSNINIINSHAEMITYSFFPKEYIANKVIDAYNDGKAIDFSEIYFSSLTIDEHTYKKEEKEKIMQLREKYHGKNIDKKALNHILNTLGFNVSMNDLEASNIKEKLFQKELPENTMLKDYQMNSMYAYDIETMEEVGFYNFYLTDNALIKNNVKSEFLKVIAENARVIDSLKIDKQLKCPILGYDEKVNEITAMKIKEIVEEQRLKNWEITNASIVNIFENEGVKKTVDKISKEHFSNPKNVKNKMEELEKVKNSGFENNKTKDINKGNELEL